MYLVNPEVVSVAEEVVVGDEPVQRPPDEVDPDGPRGRHPEVLEVDVSKVAVVQGGQLLLPASHISGEERLCHRPIENYRFESTTSNMSFHSFAMLNLLGTANMQYFQEHFTGTSALEGDKLSPSL